MGRIFLPKLRHAPNIVTVPDPHPCTTGNKEEAGNKEEEHDLTAPSGGLVVKLCTRNSTVTRVHANDVTNVTS